MMTYRRFLQVFVVPPILALAAVLAIQRRLTRRVGLAVGATSAIAVLYTGPWDSLIIRKGVWSYPPGRVLGPTIGKVPIEEYAFFVLQVLLTGLLTRLLNRRDR